MVMPMFVARPYGQADAAAWDALVARSRNGNMLHRRGYVDYHADRFVDRSLIIERNGDIVAVFPASMRDDQVTSHGGLTYAGLIASHALRAESTLAVFERIGEHYRSSGMKSIVYKAVPHIFHAYPAQEDLYALHRLGARLTRRDLSSVIDLQAPFQFTQGRRHAVGKAGKLGLRCDVEGDLADFHDLLSEVLRRHEATPTHDLKELRLLQARFPEQIVLHGVRHEGNLLAGVLVYDFGHVVHTQYMAASREGRHLDALTFLLAQLIERVYAQRRYFSFGISTEKAGLVLNAGLVAQKEYFGARAVVHDFYEWIL